LLQTTLGQDGTYLWIATLLLKTAPIEIQGGFCNTVFCGTSCVLPPDESGSTLATPAKNLDKLEPLGSLLESIELPEYIF
jgi:hypothetical protein